MKTRPLVAFALEQFCEAFLADGAERFVPLLGIATDDVTLYRRMARSLRAAVADPEIAGQPVLGMPSIAKLVAEAEARDQRALSDLLDLVELDIPGGEEAVQQDRWNTLLIRWGRGSVRSGPPISPSYVAIFEVSARLYFGIFEQPEMSWEGRTESEADWQWSALRLMVRRRYFLQFARRIRASLPDPEIAKIADWASSIVGQEMSLP